METLKEKYNKISKVKATDIDTTSEKALGDGWKNVINTDINPDTGELKNAKPSEFEYINKSFDDKLAETINEDLEFDIKKPVTTEEFTELLLSNDSILSQLSDGTDISHEDIKEILKVTNRVIKREDFNIYRSLPPNVQKMINRSIGNESIPMSQLSGLRKSIAKMLINAFINEIQQSRAKHDFAHELANIYTEGAKEIEDAALENHDERNKAYREAAENIEDIEKKERMIAILDEIDEAKSLDTLKEFAKSCKIKKIELEKPEKRAFSKFLNKYRDSANNIYNIEDAKSALMRNIGSDYSEDAINAFFISFCKQTLNYDEADPYQHAYMYYVLYYCMMSDADRSDTFLDNVKQVIDILIEVNPKIKRG